MPIGTIPLGFGDGLSSTRRALDAAYQRDQLDLTTLDRHRCGASTVVAAAIMSGREAIGRLFAALDARVPSHRRELLVRARRDYARNGELNTKSIQYLQDLLQGTFGTLDNARKGTNDREFSAMLEAMGFQSHSTGGKSLPAVVESLGRGEMIGLRFSKKRGGHVVLLGRDYKGALYVCDSSRRDKGTFVSQASQALEFSDYFDRRNARAKCGTIFSFTHDA